jgi:hypothetical protein
MDFSSQINSKPIKSVALESCKRRASLIIFMCHNKLRMTSFNNSILKDEEFLILYAATVGCLDADGSPKVMCCASDE